MGGGDGVPVGSGDGASDGVALGSAVGAALGEGVGSRLADTTGTALARIEAGASDGEAGGLVRPGVGVELEVVQLASTIARVAVMTASLRA